MKFSFTKSDFFIKNPNLTTTKNLEGGRGGGGGG